jgi:uncharacterized protein YndB with AHSA1/START domain
VRDVVKEILVSAPQEYCFAQFTEHADGWWPPTHKLVPGTRTEISFDQRVGGVYSERDADGNTARWGTVLSWEPPRFLRMTWSIDGRWRPIDDDSKASAIEVTFAAHGEQTQVTLAHVDLEKHGADAEMIYKALSSGSASGETLERFAAYCDAKFSEVRV